MTCVKPTSMKGWSTSCPVRREMCDRLNCVPSPNSNVTVFGDRDFKEVITFELSHEGRILIQQDC